MNIVSELLLTFKAFIVLVDEFTRQITKKIDKRVESKTVRKIVYLIVFCGLLIFSFIFFGGL